MKKLVELFDRDIYLVTPSLPDQPAVYYISDREVKGVLVNAPAYSSELHDALNAIAELKFIFLPSYFGAQDIKVWRDKTGAEVLAYELEAETIADDIDIRIDNKTKFTRTIDFLPMSGRTKGSCALRLKNLPGVVFFGPILEPGSNGWPTLVEHTDDYSFESRMFGVLGLQDVKFEYAFTDVFVDGHTEFGPGASVAINHAVNRALGLE